MPLFSRILAGVLLAGALTVAGTLRASAQDTEPPVGFTFPPASALVPTQLSGLMVTSIERPDDSGAFILVATREESMCPDPAPGTACAAVMVKRTYYVYVTAKTVLWDKNRRPLAGTIEVGDRINAYGGRMDTRLAAEIVRDLDKPLSTQPVQLDGLTVVGVTQGKDGIQVQAVRGDGPCWNYQGASRLSYPCPAGTQPAPHVKVGAVDPAIAVADYYTIAVPGTATVLDANRKPLKASAIEAGHRINAYGTLVARGTMQARIVRDLSVNGAAAAKLRIRVPSGSAQLQVGEEATIELLASGGTAPYTWGGANLPDGMALEIPGVILCVTAPCPQPSSAEARITGTPRTAGSFDARIVVTDAAGVSSQLTIPFTVSGDAEDLAVSVRTDRVTYEADDVVRIAVSVRNEGDERATLRFTNSCQADYDVLPGFSLRAVQLCLQALSSVTLRPGETKTYRFTHDLATHAMPKRAFPLELEVVGRVVGVGEARTAITVKESD